MKYIKVFFQSFLLWGEYFINFYTANTLWTKHKHVNLNCHSLLQFFYLKTLFLLVPNLGYLLHEH